MHVKATLLILKHAALVKLNAMFKISVTRTATTQVS